MEVVKVFFKDDTFKSFSVTEDTTVAQLCKMFIEKMNYPPNVARYLTLHVVKNGKAIKSLSATDKPLDLQKKLIGAKIKWNDQQKKNYFMFQLNEEGSKRMSVARGNSVANLSPSPPAPPAPPAPANRKAPPQGPPPPPPLGPPPSLSSIPPPPPPLSPDLPAQPSFLTLPPPLPLDLPPPIGAPPPIGGPPDLENDASHPKKPAPVVGLGVSMDAILAKRGNLKKAAPTAASAPVVPDNVPAASSPAPFKLKSSSGVSTLKKAPAGAKPPAPPRQPIAGAKKEASPKPPPLIRTPPPPVPDHSPEPTSPTLPPRSGRPPVPPLRSQAPLSHPASSHLPPPPPSDLPPPPSQFSPPPSQLPPPPSQLPPPPQHTPPPKLTSPPPLSAPPPLHTPPPSHAPPTPAQRPVPVPRAKPPPPSPVPTTPPSTSPTTPLRKAPPAKPPPRTQPPPPPRVPPPAPPVEPEPEPESEPEPEPEPAYPEPEDFPYQEPAPASGIAWCEDITIPSKKVARSYSTSDFEIADFEEEEQNEVNEADELAALFDHILSIPTDKSLTSFSSFETSAPQEEDDEFESIMGVLNQI